METTATPTTSATTTTNLASTLTTLADWKNIDVETVCRICLESKAELFLIFEDKFFIDNKSLADIIKECSSYDVQRHDGYPHQICSQCMLNVQIAYNFRKLCESSYQTIHKLLRHDDKEDDKLLLIKKNEKNTQTDGQFSYSCGQCGLNFPTFDKLMRHHRQNHISKPKICKICHTHFRSAIFLENHMKIIHKDFKDQTTDDNDGKDGQSTTKNPNSDDEDVSNDSNDEENDDFDMPSVHSEDEDDKFTLAQLKMHINDGPNLDSENDKMNLEDSMDSPLNIKLTEDIDFTINFEVDGKREPIEFEDPDDISQQSEIDHLSGQVDVKQAPHSSSSSGCLTDPFETTYIPKSSTKKNKSNKKSKSTDDNTKSTKKNIKNDTESVPQILLDEDELKLLKKKQCTVCFKVLKRKNFHVHAATHQDIKPYSCTKCDMGFSRPAHYMNHMKKFHPNSKIHRCEICPKTLTSQEQLDQHNNELHNDSTSENTLKDSKKKQCEICMKILNRRNFHTHAQTHIFPRPFNCEECDRSFSRPENYRKHIAQKHPERTNHNCSICVKEYSTQEYLDKHFEEVHPKDAQFFCTICNNPIGFINQQKLDKHQKFCGGKKVRPKKRYICEICSRDLRSKRVLEIHMKSHGPKQWSCPFCPAIHYTQAESQNHSKIHEDLKPFLCPQCGKRFMRGQALKIHLRAHTGEKPIKCQYCQKGFSRMADMKMHEKYHTDEKLHICTTCGKKFHRPFNLRLHMMIHTGERPHKCHLCPRSFTQMNDLKVHIRRHTGERFNCDLCKEGFVQNYHLTQHKKEVHGITIISRIARVKKVTVGGVLDNLAE